MMRRFDARPHSGFRLVFPSFLVAIKREEKSNMMLIKRWLEEQAADGRE